MRPVSHLQSGGRLCSAEFNALLKGRAVIAGFSLVLGSEATFLLIFLLIWSAGPVLSSPVILHTNHSLCLNDHPLVIMYLSTVVRLYAYDASFDFGARLSVTRSLVKRGLNFEDDRGKHGKHARRWQDCGAGLSSHVLKVLLCAWWRSWIVVRLRLCHGSRRRP